MLRQAAHDCQQLTQELHTHMELRYWPSARSLITLNISGAKGALNKKLLECFEDDTATPPAGMTL